MRSLKYSIVDVCIGFVCCLSLLLSLITYRMYTSAMYERYQKELLSVLDYLQTYVDADDMAECLRTGVESDAYRVCQEQFDTFIDRFTDIHYLYICSAREKDEGLRIVVVCTANSSYEKENMPENVLRLGDWGAGWYSEATLLRFWNIQNGDQDVFFKNESEWGTDYTLARPVVTSDGEHFATLCADISIADIDQAIYSNIMKGVVALLLLCLAFTALLLLWLQHNVTTPLSLLQKSVVRFAENSKEKRNLEELYQPPQLTVRNEISALSDEITKLSVSMKNYIIDIISAENVTKALRARVTEIHSFAYQDMLTKVKNKEAYTKGIEILRSDIDRGTAEFAIVMVDLNYSKKVNNDYGREHADQYISGSCQMICQVYKRSPVYRIAGDEFIVILQGQNYRDRDALLDQINDSFITSMHNESAVPWERYSAAAGMGVYQPGDSIEEVYNRAEQQMYDVKARMKRVFKQYMGLEKQDGARP